jgi:hypothetical protein
MRRDGSPGRRVLGYRTHGSNPEAIQPRTSDVFAPIISAARGTSTASVGAAVMAMDSLPGNGPMLHRVYE